MDDFSDSVMIALLPTSSDWCKIDLPHLTLVYAGEKDDHPETAFNELAKDACTIAMLSNRLHTRVLGTEVFGEEDKVDVLRLELSPELLAMRKIVEHWNASQFPFRPHVTVGPAGEGDQLICPQTISFDRVMVGWGEERLTFNLKGY